MGLVEIKKLFSKHQSLDFEKASPINQNARGIPAIVIESEKIDCSQCGECTSGCPTNAITIEGKSKITFDYGACLQCGICTDLCPSKIIRDTNFIYVFGFHRDELKITFENGNFEPKEYEYPPNVKSYQNLTNRNGMKYREVAAAGNNSVECELNASFNNFFDSEGNQITSVASPKHADAILFSGPVSKNMEGPLRTAWECTTEPKALIAGGTEAISGGVYPPGKLPAIPDLFIGGDPPRPDVMINAMRYLMGKWKFIFQKAFHERIVELKKKLKDKLDGK